MNAADIRTAFFIAYKTVTKGHKSTVALIVFLLSLAFFNLMFVSGFLSGFSEGIMRSMIDTTTAHIIVKPQEEPTKKAFIQNQASVRAQLETIPGIIATTSHYQLSGSFSYDKGKNGKFEYASAPVIGVNQGEERDVLMVHKNMVAGEFPDDLGNDGIVLGANLSGGYGTKQTSDLGEAIVGDKVQVLYSNGAARTYTIRGIFKITMGSVANTAFISSREAEAILSTYDSASEIMVRVDLTKGTLDDYIGRIGMVVPFLQTEKYTDRLATVGILVAAFNIISFIVSVISVVVAAITIFVMIYVNAVSKRRQIGILKAIGIKESILELSYVIQSLFYTTLGIGIGLAIVFFAVEPLFAIRPIPMPYGDASLFYTSFGIFINITSLIVAGIFAGFIPAKIVAKENVLQSIWG